MNIRNILNRLKTLRSENVYTEITCDTFQDVARGLKSKDLKKVRFLIKPSDAVMSGAFRYKEGFHPFVSYLVDGMDLGKFYNQFCPKDVEEMYSIPDDGRQLSGLPPWTLPWLAPTTSNSPSAEGGLDITDGVSYYGPASLRKTELEKTRLDTISNSIQNKGYRPDEYGNISGWFLENNGEWRFLVRGGKHRAAALSALNFSRMPVRIKKQGDSVIRLSQAETWESVRKGYMSEELASEIFLRFFETSDRWRHPVMPDSMLTGMTGR